MNAATTKPPFWFWIVAAVALIWNALGVMAFVMHVTMSPEALSALPEAERALYENAPSWVTAAFAIAVFGGLLGSAALLFRSGMAVLLLSLSLLGVLGQATYNFLLSDTFAVLGNDKMVMPIIVIVIAVILAWFSTYARKQGWIG